MKTFFAMLRASAGSLAIFVLLLCGVFPLMIWALGQVLFPYQANGSLVIDDHGTVIGSALLAQGFTRRDYFWPRPSAAGAGYDAANSGGSNLGPTSKKLATSIAAAVTAYRAANGLAANVAVPADAATASGSGLDPDISLANARLQAIRVARARHLDPAKVQALVAAQTMASDLQFLGEPRVNVLDLNLALDRL